MKKLGILMFFALGLNGSFNAQTAQANSGSLAGQKQTDVNQSVAKTKFIANQDYLSASSNKDYKNFYGDSLKGFDEMRLKTDLLAKGLYGQEIMGHIENQKRIFIKQKYHIGVQPTYLPADIQLNTINFGTPKGKVIGTGNTINTAPCINEDFELCLPGVYSTSLSVAGWTLSSRTQDGNCTSPSWNPGAAEFSIIATPVIGYPTIGTIPHSPLGGTKIAWLNNNVNNNSVTRIVQTFPVTNANTLFQFAYGGYWQDGGGGHGCCDQPAVQVRMRDCLGAPLACSNLSLAPGAGCQSANTTFTVVSGIASWTNWQVKYIDLTPFIGTCVTFEIYTTDCAFGGHYGTTFFDARCGGQLVGLGLGGPGGSIAGPVSFCAGANVASVAAPLGYSTYQWYAPGGIPISAPQGTMSTLTVTNPVPFSVYTVDLTAASGCQFVATNTIVFSQVNIAGIGSSSTCAGGASGSGTVQGNGSGSGYNYTWLNSSSLTVGTASVVNNLAPGIYSVVLTGFGAAGCGSAVATITVVTGPPGIISLLKPFCSTEAYLGTSGGTNYHWYHNTTAILAPLGTAPGYTVTAPVNLDIYWLSYLSAQGCQDSIRFQLLTSPPGLIMVTPPNFICPGGNNGQAVINMSPAPSAPPGANSYLVFSTGLTPAYNSSLYPTASNVYTATGLQAGSYSVVAFDGSCKYNTTFNIAPYIFNYSVSPTSPTLCPNNAVAAAITFPTPVGFGEYTYSWTPSTFLAGNTQQSTIIQPYTPIGTQTTIIYNIVVTPTLVNCPIAKTLTITAVNPPTPTITPIPNLCDISSQYLINVSPLGGTFLSGITGTANPISLNSGLFSPTLVPIGVVKTFTYSIAVNTCVATNTSTYIVSKFNTAALTSSVPAHCVTNGAFNLMNIVQSTVTGVWSSSQLPGSVVSNNFIPSNTNNSFPANVTQMNIQMNYNTTSTPIQGVCDHSASISVAITKTITPLISTVPEFCTNAAFINMTVTPSGGTWYNNSAISAAGVINPTIMVNTPSSVTHYSIQIGPCVNTNTSNIYASTFNPAGFTGAINNLCYNSQPFNLMSVAQGTTYGSWTLPAPYSGAISQNSLSPLSLITGVYTLTYHRSSFPNLTLCEDTRTITVSVMNPPAPVITTFGPICSIDAIKQLSVTPNSGAWTSSPYLTTSGVFTPSACAVGNNVIQYVIGSSTCNRSQTKFINVEGFIPATILSKISDQCNTGSAVNLSPFTLSNLGVWSGSGISGTSFNPGLTGAGTVVLIHKTASSPSGLCPDQATIAVNVYSLAVPILTKVNPVCNSSAPFQFTVSPVGGLFGGANSNVVSQGGKFEPSAAFIGNNIINYSITSGPCVAYAQLIVSVEKFVSADFAKEVPKFCKTDAAINLNSFVQNPNGDWAGLGVTPNTGMFTPGIANIGNVNTVTYTTHSMPTATLCPDTSIVRIDVRETPTVVAVSSKSEGCAPHEVSFNTPSYNEGKGVWDFGDGSELVTSLVSNYVYTKPGVYHVTFNYANDAGCSAKTTISYPIKVYDVPKADFILPDEVFISNPEIQISNNTTVLGNNTYEWKIAGVTSTNKDVNPRFELPKIGKYPITLTATSYHGCKDEITKTLEIKNDFNIFIPTSFSPNFDGLNDYFAPVFSEYGLDMKSFEMEIFDRWGHSLYRTKDPNKGWDGSALNKGEPLKEEVYIFRIKYKDMDGNAYNKMGHVSLVK